MVTVIKRGSPPKMVKEKYEKLRRRKGQKNIKKFCGVVKLKEDPLKLQKQWRDEWE